jgi:hypothetical protein
MAMPAKLTLTEIRVELLEQHGDIRAAMADVSRELGAPKGERLRGLLAKLADVVRRHNRREEELLRDVVPTIDAWGKARDEIMREEHVKEHEALWSGLIEAGVADDAAAAERRARALLDRLEVHMAKEEKSFLNEDVLRDDVVLLDSFTG